jgi:fused signal recognition particle receptor
MFENLKKKLKSFISKSSEELEAKEVPSEEVIEEVPEEEAPAEPEEVEKPKPKPKAPKKKKPKKAEEIAVTPEEEEILKEVEEEIKEEEVTVTPEAAEVIKEVEEEVKEEPKKEKKKWFKRLKKPKPEPEEAVEEEPAPEKKGWLEEKPKKAAPKPKKKLGLFSKITKKKVSEKDLENILWDLELALLENDVAKEVTEKIVENTKKELLGEEAGGSSVEEIILNSVRDSIENILSLEKPDIFSLIDSKAEKPYVIVFFGFNGTGKTLTIGKFAKMLKEKGYSVVMAAGDTFRAAAIEQLEVHAQALDVPIIKQSRGADSAAVIYDAVAHAKSKGIDIVLADTAGRAATNINLMDELRKIVRVNTPDFKIFVGDALTGNDAADQAQLFMDAVGIDASVLNKIDCDAKGGACLSVSYITKKPIMYFGTGQGYEDIMEFDPDWFVGKVF